MVASGGSERVDSDIRYRNVDNVRLSEARFRLVDGIYVYADIIIFNATTEAVDVSCEYRASSAHASGAGYVNYTLEPGSNGFSRPISTAIYNPAEDIFSSHSFRISCELGHHPRANP